MWLLQGALWILMQDPMVAAESAPTPDSKLLYKQTPQGPLHLNVFYPEDHSSDQKTRHRFLFLEVDGWAEVPPNFTLNALIWHRGAWWPSVPLIEHAMSTAHRHQRAWRTESLPYDGYDLTHRNWVDLNRIVAGGGSAGGHVAAATATVERFDAPTDPRESALPNALVLFNPVYDNGPEGYGHERVEGYWQAFSPMHRIHERMPPAIVFMGHEGSADTGGHCQGVSASHAGFGNSQ